MNARVVLVTGGTGGLGTAISQRMATQGYQVIAAYFKKGQHDLARAWQENQKKLGFDIEIAYANLTCFDDCTKLTDMIIERYKKIDILVNNAGITQDVKLEKMTLQQWSSVITANLDSVFNITRSILPFMIAESWGRIISVASINAEKGQFGQCNYASSKAGLYGFSKSLAQEVAKKNITVNTVSPGYIKTEILNSIKVEILDKIIANIPVGRLGRPEEVAHVVSFLSNEESGFITGANFDINGGQYM